jgi:hypothetical protein
VQEPSPITSVERNYPQEYKEYPWLRAGTFVPYLLLLPATLIIAVPLCMLSDSSVPGFIVFIIIAIPFLVFGRRLARWQCPRCGNCFHSNGYLGIIPARRCLNCGLPVREPSGGSR